MFRALLLALLPTLLSFAAKPSFTSPEPTALYLTWIHDPATTMTIQWHTSPDAPASTISYKKLNTSSWQRQHGSSLTLKEAPILVHTTELTNLEPDTFYTFQIEGQDKTHTFRTLPQTLNRPLRFAVGGDAYFSLQRFRKMNTLIAKQNPDFIVVGGDIAYARGFRTPFADSNWAIKRWQTFFEEWQKQMVAPDGRLIPLIPVLGNHDIRAKQDAPNASHLFYQLFAFPEPNVPCRTLDVASSFSLIVLDTGHHLPIVGKQTSWLECTLGQRQSYPYKFAVYHVAAYPSVYPYHGVVPSAIRAHWVPLFEHYHLQAAFENHNHAYKLTHPIKEGKIDPTGVLYLGDGSWGVNPRPTHKAWYLARSEQINSFWLVTLNQDACTLQSLDINGKPLDRLTLSPNIPAAAPASQD